MVFPLCQSSASIGELNVFTILLGREFLQEFRSNFYINQMFDRKEFKMFCTVFKYVYNF